MVKNKEKLKEQILDLVDLIKNHDEFIKKLQQILVFYKNDSRIEKNITFIPGVKKSYGVNVPILNDIAKKLGNVKNSSIFSLLNLLWTLSHEERMIAAKSLEWIAKWDYENAFLFIQNHLNSINNWAICDSLGMFGMRNVVTQEPDNVLLECKKWILDENRWTRRLGIVSIIPLTRLHPDKYQIGKKEFSMIESLLTDHDDMIKKGIAWVLREISRKNPILVNNFLMKHSSTKNKHTKWIIKNSLKKLSKQQQEEIRKLLDK